MSDGFTNPRTVEQSSTGAREHRGPRRSHFRSCTTLDAARVTCERKERARSFLRSNMRSTAHRTRLVERFTPLCLASREVVDAMNAIRIFEEDQRNPVRRRLRLQVSDRPGREIVSHWTGQAQRWVREEPFTEKLDRAGMRIHLPVARAARECAANPQTRRWVKDRSVVVKPKGSPLSSSLSKTEWPRASLSAGS